LRSIAGEPGRKTRNRTYGHAALARLYRLAAYDSGVAAYPAGVALTLEKEMNGASFSSVEYLQVNNLGG
jgi:hypothetical protein